MRALQVPRNTGRITADLRDDGRPDRQHVMGSQAEVTRRSASWNASATQAPSAGPVTPESSRSDALGGEHRGAVRPEGHRRRLPGCGERPPHSRCRQAPARPATARAPGEAVRTDDAQRQRGRRSLRRRSSRTRPTRSGSCSRSRWERSGTRWAVALALGLRQGDTLGLKWPDVETR